MRLVFTILFLFKIASAQTFHVSSSGNDSNDGLSTETSWLTISKVNSTASTGDSVYFRRGDTWNEQLRPAGSNMYFGAYGTGARPILTGFQTITLSDQGGNIWSGTATNAPTYLNTVLINGALGNKARFPNYGYLHFTAPTTTSIKTTTLTGTPDYTGYEAVIRTRAWITETVKITSQSLDTLRFPVLNYLPVTTNGPDYNYFLQNKDSFLDTLGEYTIDSTTKTLKVYYPSGGAAPTVYYSNKDTLVYFKNKNSITIDGIELSGSNDKGIRIDTSRNFTIQNSLLKNHGKDAIYPRGSPQIYLFKDTITDCLNDGFFASHASDTTSIDSCVFKRIGLLEGMAASGNAAAVALYSDGKKNNIQRITIDSTGYNGISIEGTNSLVQYNLVKNTLIKKGDGGAIYIVGNTPTTGTIVRKNIVLNGLGYTTSVGVYFDYNTNDALADSNTAYNFRGMGFLLNSGHRDTFRYNLSVNEVGQGFQYSPGGGSALTFTDNILYTIGSSQLTMYSFYGLTADRNVYSRPALETNKFKLTSTIMSFPAWKIGMAGDANSTETPTGITGVAPLFYYNATMSDSTISLSGLYVNARGVEHNNSIVLKPFASALLFKADHEIPVPRNILKIGSLNFISE